MADSNEPGGAATATIRTTWAALSMQQRDYAQALAEVRSGRKRSHWMWYVFPQFAGLGFSSTAQHYAIKSLDECGRTWSIRCWGRG